MQVTSRQSAAAPVRFPAVAAAYAAQSFGYAALTTALPFIRDRTGLSVDQLSYLLLGLVFGAALGSVIADFLAVRLGSRGALMTGMLVEAAAFFVVSLVSGPALMIPVLVLGGIGLGIVDASTNMQGTLLERHRGQPVFGTLFAVYTAAGIVSTLVTFAAVSAHLPGTTTIMVAAFVHAGVALGCARGFSSQRAAHDPRTAKDPSARLPWRGIFLVGTVIFAGFVIDTAVSTWASTYSQTVLLLPTNLWSLAYGVYLVAVLLARLAVDPLIRRFGRAPLALTAAAVGFVGCLALVLGHPTAATFIGFALAGFASGWLIPLAFARAGELLPERSDEVIARVNLFNYAAAVLGAVLPSVIAGFTGINWSFILPALALILCLPALRALRHADPRRQQAG